MINISATILQNCTKSFHCLQFNTVGFLFDFQALLEQVEKLYLPTKNDAIQLAVLQSAK